MLKVSMDKQQIQRNQQKHREGDQQTSRSNVFSYLGPVDEVVVMMFDVNSVFLPINLILI